MQRCQGKAPALRRHPHSKCKMRVVLALVAGRRVSHFVLVEVEVC